MSDPSDTHVCSIWALALTEWMPAPGYYTNDAVCLECGKRSSIRWQQNTSNEVAQYLDIGIVRSNWDGEQRLHGQRLRYFYGIGSKP